MAARKEPCMTRRLQGWDYCRPWIYEVNLEMVDRDARALGEIVVDAKTPDGIPTAAHCELSPLGRRVLECWFAIEKFHPKCKVLAEQVMPEHFHGIIRVMERLEAMRIAGEEGAVMVCPCFSEGERYICNEAYRLGYPVITLKNMGFNRYEKPVGKLFDRCAEGKLLYLAPLAWPYQSAAKPLTRQDGVALNRIAQLLAGEGAAEVNYKGIAPSRIDDYVAEITKARG